jgi:hypothetical protein
MRPKSIVSFELIIFGTILLGVFNAYFGWDRPMLGSQLDRNVQAILFLMPAILGFAFVIWLTLLVSRRRSKIAMWFFISMFVLGVAMSISRGQLLELGTIAVLQLIGQAVAVGLLFTPSARRWMNRKNEKLSTTH